MGFLDNHKESEIQERKLYTGIAEFKVIAVNPDKKQLEEIQDRELENEPEYTGTTESGKPKVRLDFYIESVDGKIRTKFPIWVSGDKVLSRAENKQFINRKLQSTYAKSKDDLAQNENMTWFDLETAREAYEGEVELYDFIAKITNAETGKDADLEFEDIKAIIKGDVSELKAIVEKLGKTVRLMLGVKDGKYQDVFRKYVQRGHIKGTKTMIKYVADEDYGFQSDYQNSLELQEYAPTEVAEKEYAEDETVYKGQDEEDDLF